MKTILGFFAGILVLVVLLVLIARGITSRRSSAPTPSPKLNSVSSSEASFLYREIGPITASENHYQIEVVVSKHTRVVRVIRGFEGEVVASKSFSNDKNAFDEFLSALDRAGYTTKRKTSLESDEGVCPLNRRYVFESDQFDKKFRRWTTDCQEKGNFGGKFDVVRTLFKAQIPEYETFLSDTRKNTGLTI